MNRIKELEALLKKASEAYYNTDSTIMSDEEFDKFRDELQKLDPNNAFLREVGAPPANTIWPKSEHFMHMGSQLKINTHEELREWSSFYTSDTDFVWSEKLDGLSIELVYLNGVFKQGITRGDGVTGDDRTQNIKELVGVPEALPDLTCGQVSIRGEALLWIKDWEQHFSDKRNPRNAAAGALNRLDGKGCDKIRFVAFDVDYNGESYKKKTEKFETLEALGFLTPKWGKVSSVEEVQKVYDKYQDDLRSKLPYEIDGLIIEENSLLLQSQHGTVDNRPKSQRAYKFKSLEKETTILGVTWQTGRTGVITPVAEVVPTDIGGVTVSRISLMNLDEIERIGAQIGARVVFQRANDVIPRVLRSITQGLKIAPPPVCPSCGMVTIQDGPKLLCTNKTTCPAQNQNSVLNYLKVLDVKGFGDKLAIKLMEAGKLKDPTDLYKLQVSDIANLEGCGEKNAKKVLSEIKSKSQDITAAQFIGALGIPMVSSRTAERMLESFSLEELLTVTESQLVNIHKVGDAVAAAFVSGIKTRLNIAKELLSNCVTIKSVIKVNGGPLDGQAFCFTGFRDKNVEEKIAALGGKIASGVSKTTTHLVLKDRSSTSSKTQKAKELGVEIIAKEDLLKLLARYTTWE